MARTFGEILWWAWVLSAGGFAWLGTSTLLFRRPARARLIENGYRRDCKARLGAVFHKEVAPAPLLVEDWAEFVDGEGARRRVRLVRMARDHDEHLLLWYRPGRPESASAMGPFHWYGLAAASCATYAAWIFG